MKKIINGKLYDTDTAKNLAEYNSPFPEGHEGFCVEILYRKTNGEYYLYEHTDSEQIKPISVEKAKKWFEKRIDNADKFIEIFGTVDE